MTELGNPSELLHNESPEENLAKRRRLWQAAEADR